MKKVALLLLVSAIIVVSAYVFVFRDTTTEVSIDGYTIHGNVWVDVSVGHFRVESQPLYEEGPFNRLSNKPSYFRSSYFQHRESDPLFLILYAFLYQEEVRDDQRIVFKGVIASLHKDEIVTAVARARHCEYDSPTDLGFFRGFEVYYYNCKL